MEIPARIGPYSLIETLGSGSMATVFRARHAGLDRDIALKVFARDKGAHKQSLERFQREARILSRLRHPGVVEVMDVGEADAQHYIAMELIAGQDLGTAIAEAQSARPLTPPFPLERSLPLMRDIARAVGYVHEQGYIHRDLKPANVLLDETGRPHLTDFGLGRALGSGSDLTREGQIMGTPFYMAPETFDPARRREPGPASDVFSLGVLLYELLTGRRPFAQPAPAVLLRAIAEDDPLPPRRLDPRIPAALEAICLQALCKDPRHRYPHAGALADDLDRLLRFEDTQARGEPWHARWARKLRQHKAAALLVALLPASLIAGWTLQQDHLRAQRLAAAAHQAQLARQEQRQRALEREQAEDLARLRQAERRLEGADAIALRGSDPALLKAASAAIAQATVIAPRSARAHYLQGRIRHRLGELEAALEAYDRALALDERHAGTRFYRGVVLLWTRGDLAAAEASFADMPQGEEEDALRELGRLNLAIARGVRRSQAPLAPAAEPRSRTSPPADARGRAQALAERLPLHAEVWFLLGRLRAGLSFEPGDEFGMLALGRSLRQWSSPDIDAAGARAALDKALELDPLHYQAAYARAWLSLSERDFDRAEADLARCLRIHPRYVPPHVLWARLEFSRQRFDEAQACYTRAHGLARFELPEEEGLLCFAQGRYAEAERHFAKITPEALAARGPVNLDPMSYIRVINLAALGRWDEVLQLWERVMELQGAPMSKVMEDFQAILPWLLPRLSRIEELLPQAHRVLELDPAEQAFLAELYQEVERTPLLARVFGRFEGRAREMAYLGRFLSRPAREVRAGGPLAERLDELSRRVGALLPIQIVLPFLIYRARRAEQFDLLQRSQLFDADDCYLRANAHYLAGDLRAALSDLAQAVRLEPQRMDFHWGATQVLGGLNRPDLALQAFRRAYRLGFEHWDWVACHPALEALRAQPGFQEMERRR